jgi:hypothetical protein
MGLDYRSLVSLAAFDARAGGRGLSPHVYKLLLACGLAARYFLCHPVEVEKHLTRSMDLDGNHKMDWFFNQYVYGTGIPHYNFHASLEATADGKTHVKGEITRGGVPDSWKDVVPLYAHQGDKTLRLGTISVTHAIEPLDFVLPIKLDRVSINDHEDLLAEVKQ